MTSTLAAPRPRTARPQVHRVTSARPARSVRPTRPASPPRPVPVAVAAVPLVAPAVPAARRPVRLTRRGRLLLLAVLVALVFSLASLGAAAVWASGPGDGDGGSSGPVATQWVVQPGESLWQVAVAVAPDTDPRDTVARIVELNDLTSTTVTAGQTLLVPA